MYIVNNIFLSEAELSATVVKVYNKCLKVYFFLGVFLHIDLVFLAYSVTKHLVVKLVFKYLLV